MTAVNPAHLQPQAEDSCPSCPFCSYRAPSRDEGDFYMLLQHLELSHPENGESPFIARDDSPPRQRRRSTSRASSRSNTGRGSRSSSFPPQPELLDEDFYVDCPLKCGEAVHIRELEDHMDLHDIEGQGFDDVEHAGSSRHASPAPINRSSSSYDRSKNHVGSGDQPSIRRSVESLHVPDSERPRRHREISPLNSLKELFLGPAPRKTRPIDSKAKPGYVRRLGKAELGPHAYEEQMPAWLYQQLDRGAKVSFRNIISPSGKIQQVEKVANETSGIIPVLARLCARDNAISKVFLCHPSVKHIFKTPKEGGFCGYRNIQMLISFMQGTKFPGHESFPGTSPSILRLQDMIEAAWDQGFNSSGRIETGGIRGTRKYIGTPEAQALFCSLDISCEATAFNKSRGADTTKTYVHVHVLEAVLTYFSTGVVDVSQKVYQTGLAPIYFQHPGHSLCIIGLEVRKNGSMNLLVFDPMFKTAPGITRLIDSRVHSPQPEKLLKAFRRGDAYLGKYNSFEILQLMTPAARYREEATTLPPEQLPSHAAAEASRRS